MPQPPALARHTDSRSERRLLRNLRLRLIAWSAASTFVVLLVLGAAIYGAVASSLAATSTAQLEARAKLVSVVSGTAVSGGGVSAIAVDPSSQGLVFGGSYSGTLAVVLPANQGVLGGAAAPSASEEVVPTANDVTGTGQPGGAGQVTIGSSISASAILPDKAGYAAALAGHLTVDEVTVGDGAFRVLSLPATMNPLGAVVQVAVDRADELQTLRVVLAILVIGGIVALLGAMGLGYLYAGRALVPIRESMRRQREFAADTSHELRTPLAIIRGSVEHLRRHADEPVRQVGDALDDIETEVVRVGTLVDDLLLLARDEAGALELDRRPMDLADAAAGALGGLEPLAAARGVRLELDVEPSPVLGDGARLERLVAILVDNGIRHGREGGTVRVVVRPGATLEVDDDGPGIRPEDLPHVFERFWRAPGAVPGGSGLGLAIAAWIAEHHGGRIAAMAADGGGTTFRVTLPGV